MVWIIVYFLDILSLYLYLLLLYFNVMLHILLLHYIFEANVIYFYFTMSFTLILTCCFVHIKHMIRYYDMMQYITGVFILLLKCRM